MKLMFHIHVPKCLDFALDAACDDIVKHGVSGLDKAIPLPLYYKCIVTYAKKHGDYPSAMKMYRSMARGVDVLGVSVEHGDEPLPSISYHPPEKLPAVIALIDHFILDFTNADAACDLIRRNRGDNHPRVGVVVSDVVMDEAIRILVLCCCVNQLILHSIDDGDGAVVCLHRLASRCMTRGLLCLLQLVMHDSELAVSEFGDFPDKPVRDVMLQYAGGVDSRRACELSDLCAWGMHEIVQERIKRGERPDSDGLRHAYASADIDTIRLVSSASDEQRLSFGGLDNDVRDYTVSLCDELIKLGLIKPGSFGPVHFRSISVLGWMLDHGCISPSDALVFVVHDALSDESGYCVGDDVIRSHSSPIDMLHYLVEHRHVVVVHDLFSCVFLSEAYHEYLYDGTYRYVVDLGVFDYLIQHGAVIKPVFVSMPDDAVERPRFGHSDSDCRDDDHVIVLEPRYARYWIDKGALSGCTKDDRDHILARLTYS